MKRATVTGLLAVCLGVAACGGNREAQNEEAAAGQGSDTAEAKPRNVTETGCLTARGDQFVLTDLQPTEGATGTAETQTYQLIGMDDELRKHVGKQVRVAGEAAGAQVAVVRESSPDAGQPAGTSGAATPRNAEVPRSQGQGDAAVSTESQARMEVRQLRVASVTATGDSCADEAKTSDEGAAKRPGR